MNDDNGVVMQFRDQVEQLEHLYPELYINPPTDDEPVVEEDCD